MTQCDGRKAGRLSGLFRWRRARRIGLAVAGLVVAAFCLAARGENIVVGCIGDYGGGGTYEANVARLVQGWKPRLIITVGDNNYPSGEVTTIDANIGRFYHDFIHPYQGNYGVGADENRFFPSLGNHEYFTTGAWPHFDYFELPGNERYYTFTNGPVQFFCLNSDTEEPDGAATDSRQAGWLRRELGDSTASWRVVYFHHAPYSSGILHGTHTHEADRMRWPFRDWRAHVVLSGHDHVYERLRVNGLTYFVNGLGGESWDKFHWPPHPASVKRFTGDFGALRLDATETNLTFRFITWRQQVADVHVLCKPVAAAAARRSGRSFEIVRD